MQQALLEVRHLTTAFKTKSGPAIAVSDVSFCAYNNRTLGIVGESGCGKSVTCLSVMRQLPHATGYIAGGEILYKGEHIERKSNREMCTLRGKEISMIFQDSMTSLNPVLNIGRQLTETIRTHMPYLDKGELRDRAEQMLAKVGISSPGRRLREFPHQLSGGMRQRVMIAMALACDPSLLIADEPTTALDVTIQAQILDLISELKDKYDAGIILITHDMGVVAELADDIMVMYAGQAVEFAVAAEIFRRPLHPYTRGLLASIPRTDRDMGRLYAIRGTVPTLRNMPAGCRFCARCGEALPQCREEPPPLFAVDEKLVRCWLYRDAGREVEG